MPTLCVERPGCCPAGTAFHWLRWGDPRSGRAPVPPLKTGRMDRITQTQLQLLQPNPRCISPRLTVKQVWVVDALSQIHQDVQQSVLAALLVYKSVWNFQHRERWVDFFVLFCFTNITFVAKCQNAATHHNRALEWLCSISSAKQTCRGTPPALSSWADQKPPLTLLYGAEKAPRCFEALKLAGTKHCIILMYLLTCQPESFVDK